MKQVMIVEFKNERSFAGVFSGPCFDKSQRRRVCVAAGIERELEMIARIISRRIDCETAGGTVFKALVDRQDDKFSGSAELAMIHHAGQVAANARIFGFVPA